MLPKFRVAEIYLEMGIVKERERKRGSVDKREREGES